MIPLISVIMPTYNNEKTIHAAISSVLMQSYTDFELIVYNDGSTDNTKNIVQSFSDERIILIDGFKNKGLPQVLNECLKLSRGKYIARMDADDICFPNRFERQVDFLDNNLEIDLVGARAVIFDDENILGILPYCNEHKDLVRYPWNNIPMPHPTWMARKEWILKYGYAIPEIWRAEDQDLLLRAHKESQYHCLPDILLCYRQSKFDLSKSFLARRNLLKAQIKYFLSEKEYINFALSCCMFLIKSLKDVFFGGAITKISDEKITKYAKELIHKHG